MENVAGGEMFVNQIQKFFSHVRFYIKAVWWIEPSNSTLACFGLLASLLIVTRSVFQDMVITTSVQLGLVCRDSFLKNLSVGRVV